MYPHRHLNSKNMRRQENGDRGQNIMIFIEKSWKEDIVKYEIQMTPND